MLKSTVTEVRQRGVFPKTFCPSIPMYFTRDNVLSVCVSVCVGVGVYVCVCETV